MIVKLLTEYHLVFLNLTGGCRGSSETSRVKMSHCWKSHDTAHLFVGGSVWNTTPVWSCPGVAQVLGEVNRRKDLSDKKFSLKHVFCCIALNRQRFQIAFYLISEQKLMGLDARQHKFVACE